MRVPVELRRAYRLLNHGPTTLLSSAHGGRRNVMAAAWVVPVDFDPPKLAIVISSDACTRELVEASGELVVQLPTASMAALTKSVGSCSGREGDKFERFSIATSPASIVSAPLVDGCAAWLEARLIPEPGVARAYDLLLCEVVAAWADDRSWTGSEWHFTRDEDRTIHHQAGGVFFATGERISTR